MIESRQERRARFRALAKHVAAAAKGKPLTVQVHAHFLVAKTAKDMAAQVYELWASQNDGFFAEHRSQEEYVAEAWPLFLEDARATLAKLLGTNINERLKVDIHSALMKDATLRRGRGGALPQQFILQ